MKKMHMPKMHMGKGMKMVKHPLFGKMRGKTLSAPKPSMHRMGGLPK
jgi:hypothetical protein